MGELKRATEESERNRRTLCEILEISPDSTAREIFAAARFVMNALRDLTTTPEADPNNCGVQLFSCAPFHKQVWVEAWSVCTRYRTTNLPGACTRTAKSCTGATPPAKKPGKKPAKKKRS